MLPSENNYMSRLQDMTSIELVLKQFY